MANKLERSNPLPPGRYWLDVYGDNRDHFIEWLKSAGIENVRVLKFEQHPEEANGHDWHLFEVVKPTAFPHQIFGSPTIAEAHVDEMTDTEHVPPPDSPPPSVEDVVKGTAKTIATVAIIGAGLYFLRIVADLRGRR